MADALTPDEVARLNALREAVASQDPGRIRAAMRALATQRRKPRAPHKLKEEQQLILKIEEVRAERDRLLGLSNAGTATAIGQTHRLETELLRELREVRAVRPTVPANPAAELSDEDLIKGICDAIVSLSDVAMDQIERAVALRRTGRPTLRVVDGDGR
jgi:hypothetical protein